MEAAEDEARLLARLRDQGTETVVLAGSDTHGLMRGKRLPIGELQRVLDRGLALCDVFWVMQIDESDLVRRPDGHHGYFPSETEGYPDIYAHPDARHGARGPVARADRAGAVRLAAARRQPRADRPAARPAHASSSAPARRGSSRRARSSSSSTSCARRAIRSPRDARWSSARCRLAQVPTG